MVALHAEIPGIVLYEPERVRQAIEAHAPKPMSKDEEEDEDEKFWRAQFQSPIRDPHIIVGFLALFPVEKTGAGPCWGATEVKLAAAHQGYGPMLYDVAMAIAPNHTLISDRGSVSISAQRIWDFYLNQRSDVEKLKLDDKNNPQTPPTEDDCELHNVYRPSLNYAYKGRGQQPTALEATHEKFMKELIQLAKKRGLDLTPESAENDIYWSGRMFFSNKYRGD